MNSTRESPSLATCVDFRLGSRKAVALATLIAAVPIAFVFIVSQRALLRGLVSGATKS